MIAATGKYDRLFYVPVLALIVFYLFVISAVFRPDISPEYRLYYIDKQLKNWPKSNGLEYRPGDVIDFQKVVPYLSRQGWSQPEKWGTWTLGNEASLILRLDKPAPKDLELVVEMIAFVGPALPVQTVSVSVNGKPVDEWTYAWGDKKRVFRAVVPAELIETNGYNRIDFMIPNAKSPSALGKSKDRRVLGIGVSSAALREFGDGE